MTDMIERLKLWLALHNIKNVEKKIKNGTATEQNLADLSRMNKWFDDTMIRWWEEQKESARRKSEQDQSVR